MIILPHFNPVALSLGYITIRWYSLAYIAGIFIGHWLLTRNDAAVNKPVIINKIALDNIIIWAVFGILVGGRLGYVLFYNFSYFLHNPIEIIEVWHGGMSFHGGMIGLMVAMMIFAKKYQIKFLALMDLIASVAPIGIFFGRLTNFINLELYGRHSNVPWAMIFPNDTDFPLLPRHPSQLYEAALEGVLLFVVMNLFIRSKYYSHKYGNGSALFLLLYGVIRIFCECFRQPDIQIGDIAGIFTMGQLLSVQMIFVAVAIFYWNKKR